MVFFLGYLIDTFRVSGIMFGFSFASMEKPGCLYRSQTIFMNEELALLAAQVKVLETICDRSYSACVLLHPVSDRVIRVNEPGLKYFGRCEGRLIWDLGANFEELLEAKSSPPFQCTKIKAITIRRASAAKDYPLKIIWLPSVLLSSLEMSVWQVR
jgi:hypothetical protein